MTRKKRRHKNKKQTLSQIRQAIKFAKLNRKITTAVVKEYNCVSRALNGLAKKLRHGSETSLMLGWLKLKLLVKSLL